MYILYWELEARAFSVRVRQSAVLSSCRDNALILALAPGALY